jgi:hypothetical protein
MMLSETRRLSATHQLALRCVVEGDDEITAAMRLGVPSGRVAEVVADAGAALHRLMSGTADAQVTRPTGGNG